jgi:hypothetical protein
MASIMNLPVKATMRDMVRVSLGKGFHATQPTFLMKIEALAASDE